MDSDEGKLFIGGIPWETSEERLREYFSSFGEVAEVVIMKDRATGRARGFGFVVFSDPSVADRALLEKHTIDGKLVEAKRARARSEQQSMPRRSFDGPGPASYVRTKKIFVGGLASTVSENDFRTYFEQFGSISDVVVMYDHATQRHRGFGFITFDSEDAVDNVLQKPSHEINEKPVEVKRAVPKDQQGIGGTGQGAGATGAFPASTGRGSGGYGYGYGQGGYAPTATGSFGVRPSFNPASGGSYPTYGAGGYANPTFSGGYGPPVNGTYGGSGYGGGGGYGSYGDVSYGSGTPSVGVGYGPAAYGGGGAATPDASSGGRGTWNSGSMGYASGGNPAGGNNPGGYGASGNWSSGTAPTQPAASGGYGYGAADGGYGGVTPGQTGGYTSNVGGYSGPGATTGAGPYSGGYANNGYGYNPYASATAGSAPTTGSYPMQASAEYVGYGAAGREAPKGPDNRFRPHLATG